MAGHMWFSQSRFRILGSEMHNLESIKSFGGLSGADHIIQRTEYFPTTSGPYMPKVDSVEWELRIGLFNKFRFSRKEEYSNFQMVETKSTVTPPS